MESTKSLREAVKSRSVPLALLTWFIIYSVVENYDNIASEVKYRIPKATPDQIRILVQKMRDDAVKECESQPQVSGMSKEQGIAVLHYIKVRAYIMSLLEKEASNDTLLLLLRELVEIAAAMPGSPDTAEDLKSKPIVLSYFAGKFFGLTDKATEHEYWTALCDYILALNLAHYQGYAASQQQYVDLVLAKNTPKAPKGIAERMREWESPCLFALRMAFDKIVTSRAYHPNVRLTATMLCVYAMRVRLYNCESTQNKVTIQEDIIKIKEKYNNPSNAALAK